MDSGVRIRCLRERPARRSGQRPDFEPPAFFADFENLAMAREPVVYDRRYLRIVQMLDFSPNARFVAKMIGGWSQACPRLGTADGRRSRQTASSRVRPRLKKEIDSDIRLLLRAPVLVLSLMTS